MRIFLSYATEQKSVAEPIAFSLRSRGHSVFLDKDDLPPGRSFDDQIQKAVEQSDVMIYLVSPSSVAKGRYTRTELEFARAAWRHPTNRVLPVMIEPTPIADVPSFLTGVTILEPQGNTTAEVAAAVERLRGNEHASRQFWRTAAIALAAFMIGFSLSAPLFESIVPNGWEWLFFDIVLAVAFGGAAATASMLWLQMRRDPRTLVAAFLIVFATVPLAAEMISTMTGSGVLKQIDTTAFDDSSDVGATDTSVGGDAEQPPALTLTEAQQQAIEQARSTNALLGRTNTLFGTGLAGFLCMIGLLTACSLAAPELRSPQRWFASLAVGAAVAWLLTVFVMALSGGVPLFQTVYAVALPFAAWAAVAVGMMAYWMARGRAT